MPRVHTPQIARMVLSGLPNVPIQLQAGLKRHAPRKWQPQGGEANHLGSPALWRWTHPPLLRALLQLRLS